jgi:succinate-acetate transporter protein
VGPLALAYGGIIQIIVGWWEGKTGSTFGFVAFSSYGAFWLYFAFLKIFIAIGLISVDLVAQGTVLVLWGFFTFYMWVASLKLNLATNLIFLLLWIAFVVLGLGDITGIKIIQTAGGAVALLTAIAAWYGALAVVINDTFGKTVLPMGKPLK